MEDILKAKVNEASMQAKLAEIVSKYIIVSGHCFILFVVGYIAYALFLLLTTLSIRMKLYK